MIFTQYSDSAHEICELLKQLVPAVKLCMPFIDVGDHQQATGSSFDGYASRAQSRIIKVLEVPNV